MGPGPVTAPGTGAGTLVMRICPVRAATVSSTCSMRRAVRAAEHGGEDYAVVLAPAQYLAALADPDDGLRRIVTARVFTCVRCLDPDGAVGVHADAVRAKTLGPRSAVGQAAVGGDIERGQAPGEGLRDDQRRVVRRDHHPVGEFQVAGDLARRAVPRV